MSEVGRRDLERDSRGGLVSDLSAEKRRRASRMVVRRSRAALGTWAGSEGRSDVCFRRESAERKRVLRP